MSDAADACPTVGTAAGATETLLLVSLHGPLDSRLDVWRRQDGLPENVCVVSCEETRSASAAMSSHPIGSPGDEDGDGDGGIRGTSVASPGHLVDLGRSIQQCLSTCADGEQIHVCFDSLTTLIQYVDTKPTYKFLHALLPRIHSGDGLAHFHMDPDAHDETTGRIVQSLFDATFRYDEADDEWIPG